MRAIALIGTLALLVIGLAPEAAARAAGSAPPELLVSDLFTGPGHLARLEAGVTYQASVPPITIRVTPPDGSWSGAQWKANNFSPEEIERRHLTCSTSPAVCKPPYYGWAAVGQVVRSGNVPPRGLILVLTSFQRTPSVAATVESLRTRGQGATYGETTPVELAGFSGLQFDGQVVGPKHLFIPFSPRTNKATGYADAIEMDGAGHAFRFIVLDVRGKTVVVQISSIVLPLDRFPSFLAHAQRVLATLRFPT